MARDHRIIDDNDTRVNYTCENSRYKTDVSHSAPGGRPGSVLPEPLYEGGSYSLWLEHVVEKASGKRVYWLMWYRDGVPTMPMSGVLNKDDLEEMIRRLTSVNEHLLEGAV